jgi:hypothetical protein
MAKILQFPSGKIIKSVRTCGPFSTAVIRYFDDPNVTFETLQPVYKRISSTFRRKQKAASKHGSHTQ